MMKKYFIILELIAVLSFCSCSSSYQIPGNNYNNLKNNQKEGLWVESLNKECIQIATYKSGKKEGKVIVLWNNADKEEITYKNDLKNGRAAFYSSKFNCITREDWYKDDVKIKTISNSPDF